MISPLLFLMYINDLPNASKFQSALFADDTYLCLSDTDINNLQIRVHAELQNINFWQRENKLSLNYNKTNFTLINKHPHKTVEYDFTLKRCKQLSRIDSVKYFGVHLDIKLNWYPHKKIFHCNLSDVRDCFIVFATLYLTIFCLRYTTVLCTIEFNME